jgi:hypothetical protein
MTTKNFTILHQTRHDWLHSKLQDFKSVNEYNSALFKIISQLKFCGENIIKDQILKKTLSTFHVSNIVL